MKKNKKAQKNKKKKIEDKKIEVIHIPIEEVNYTRTIYGLLCIIFLITGISGLTVRPSIMPYLYIYKIELGLLAVIQFAIAYFFMKKLKNIPSKIDMFIFITYPLINGIILALVYPVFTVLHLQNNSYSSISYNFLMAGLTFGLMNLYGLIKKNCFNMKNLIVMTITGIIITSIFNVLLNITPMYWIINYIFILISIIVIGRYSLIKDLRIELPDMPDGNTKIKLSLYLYMEIVLAFSLVILIITDVFKRNKWQ